MTTAPATIALDLCPVCRAPGGVDFTLGGAALRRCASCGAVYSQRYADPDAIYADGYYTADSPFGIDLSHPRFQAFLREVNARRAELLVSLLGSHGALLDVGCGTGDFMEAMRDRGWSVLGVDPIDESGAIARGRGLDVRTAMLADAGVPRGEWDVVSAFHVLEHVPDGPAFLRELAAWARPGGHVLVESPNWNSHLRRVAGGGYVHLRPLEHVVHLEPRTLRLAFERAGLEPVSIRTPTWPAKLQTPAEALADTGRGSLARLPGPLARAAARAGRARGRPPRAGHGRLGPRARAGVIRRRLRVAVPEAVRRLGPWTGHGRVWSSVLPELERLARVRYGRRRAPTSGSPTATTSRRRASCRSWPSCPRRRGGCPR